MQFVAHWMFYSSCQMPNKTFFLLDTLTIGPNLIFKFLYSRWGWVRLGRGGGGGGGGGGGLVWVFTHINRFISGLGGMVKREPEI